jgi:tetratricopeptide (TPR) repeat protein
MRYGEKPLRPAAAWLIPGAEPRTWLDEMLTWGVPLGDAVLYRIPRSAHDLSPQGVLVVLPAGLSPRVTHRSQAYAAVGVPPLGGMPALLVRPLGEIPSELPPEGGTSTAVVYLPVVARIDPAASDAEVATLAGEAGDCILHPTLGRIRLDADDRQRVVDLLAPPPQRPARWDLAEPGQYVNTRLTAIVPAEVPSLEQMLDQGREDIGSQSPTLDELPPEPDEPPPGFFNELARSLQRKLAQMMKRLAEAGNGGHPPEAGGRQRPAAGRGPAKPGVFSKMANWAREKMTQIDDSLRKSRHRELHRLMNLLQNDPDRGLRFALPCGEGQHRGIARPSATLPGHDVNFDLRRLGGGGRGDPWELPYDLYAQLRAKYMELAGREMRLGRYRRAAYIYAHLLGDVTNAASALVAGKHWREAAVLYRDRLKQPEMAAKCLEQGGLWAEAIEFYVQLEDFEKAGDLYAQLEQPEEAERAWRRAVEKHLTGGDRIAAANLLETKLKTPDEALAVLTTGWPTSSQAGRCLAAEFAMLGRLGRHEAAQRRVAEIRQQTLREAVRALAIDVRSIIVGSGITPIETVRARAIDVLVENAAGYPHEEVRKLAADATRTIAARHLREACGPELDHLLEALRRLVPGDRLLERDTARYLRVRTQLPRPAARPATRPATRTVVPQPHIVLELTHLSDFTLPGGVKWQCAVSCGNHFYAAGFQDRQLWLTQCNWTGHFQSRIVGGSEPDNNVLLACGPHNRHEVLIAIINGPLIKDVTFASSDTVPYDVHVGSPGFFVTNPVAFQSGANGVEHTLGIGNDGVELVTHDPHQAPTRSQLLTYESLVPGEGFYGPPVLPVPMCVRDACVYLGLRNRLVRVTADKTLQMFDMPGVVHGLCGSTPYSVGRVVAALAQGAALFWEDGLRVVPFAEELNHPLATFTASGWIVLTSAEELQVYKTEDSKLRLAVRQKRNIHPVAVLPTAHPDGFAIVHEDGLVEQYQMPRR